MELDYLYIFWGSPRPAHVTQALQPNDNVTSLGLWVPEAVGVPDSAGLALKYFLPHSPLYLRNQNIHHPYHSASSS